MSCVSLQEARLTEYQICVVGAGAAGLALATSLGHAGLRVLVIEQGGFDEGTIDEAVSKDLYVSKDTHDPRHKTNREAVTGTLLAWGGRCMPFDPEDFEKDSERHSHPWPIGYQDYRKWIAPAARFLRSDSEFDHPISDTCPEMEGVTVKRVELLNALDHAPRLQDRLKQGHEPIDLLPNTLVTSFVWDRKDGNRVRELIIKHGGEVSSLPCKRVVLACGGLETTRTLLLEQSKNPDIFCDASNTLGRYYMGHLTGGMAEISFHSPRLAKLFGYQHHKGQNPYRHRLALSSGAPANVAFWLENLASDDPRQTSGEISLKSLLKNPANLKDPQSHLVNVIKDPLGASNVIRSAAQRFMPPSMRRPQRLAHAGCGPYMLAYHAEHFPEAESQVTLSDKVDFTGRRMLTIDFRYGMRTIDALIQNHKLLAERLKDAGVADVTLPPDDAFAEAIATKSRDGYHQIGLTRMSASPETGVVDPNCRVHGTENLFVASASVFPVSGQANPTLSVVAMALRLADHLKRINLGEATA